MYSVSPLTSGMVISIKERPHLKWEILHRSNEIVDTFAVEECIFHLFDFFLFFRIHLLQISNFQSYLDKVWNSIFSNVEKFIMKSEMRNAKKKLKKVQI